MFDDPGVGDELQEKLQSLLDVAFMGSSDMLIETLRTIWYSTRRSNEDGTDWDRMMDEVAKSMTYQFRKEGNWTGNTLFGDNVTQINLQHVGGDARHTIQTDRVARTVSTYRDSYAEEYHNSKDTITNWKEFVTNRIEASGIIGGTTSVDDRGAMIRDQQGNFLQLGELSPEETRIAIAIENMAESDRLKEIDEELSNLRRQIDVISRQYTDPVVRRNVTNVINKQRRALYAEGVQELRHIEEMMRNIVGEQGFKSFRDLPVKPDAPSFRRDDVGKVNDQGGTMLPWLR